MKKYFAIVLSIIVIVCAFVACSSGKDGGKDGNKAASVKNNTSHISETQLTQTPTADSKTTTGITTDKAVIKEADAINLIQSYSAKELKLNKDDYKNCSYMVASSGEYLESKKEYYVKVIATIKTAHENNETHEITYTFDTKGEYYIRYDGKQILVRDMDSKKEKFEELKVKPVPTTTVPSTHEDQEHE